LTGYHLRPLIFINVNLYYMAIYHMIGNHSN